MSEKPTYNELEKRICELEEIELKYKETADQLNDEILWRRLITEESRDAIVIVDSDLRVFEGNTRFAEMLGYSKTEIRDLHVWDWDGSFNREQLLELMENIDETGHHFETRHRKKDGSFIDVELSNSTVDYKGKKLVFCICRDITQRKHAEKEREKLISRLKDSLAEIKTLRGILPLCSYCKKVRNDKGYWERVDVYIRKHSDADISHSICPECLEKYYPDLVVKPKNSK